jgi:hypothetical protein
MEDLIEILAVLLVKEPGSSNHAGRAVIGLDMKLVPELASFLSKDIRPWQHSLSVLPVQFCFCCLISDHCRFLP